MADSPKVNAAGLRSSARICRNITSVHSAFMLKGRFASASSLMAAGLLMMKSRSAHLPVAAGANVIGALAAWIRDPIWLGGIGVQTAGWACYVVAVSHAPVSAVAVMMQGGIGLFVIASVIVLGERASRREWTGIGAIILAMLMLGLSLDGVRTALDVEKGLAILDRLAARRGLREDWDDRDDTDELHDGGGEQPLTRAAPVS